MGAKVTAVFTLLNFDTEIHSMKCGYVTHHFTSHFLVYVFWLMTLLAVYIYFTLVK